MISSSLHIDEEDELAGDATGSSTEQDEPAGPSGLYQAWDESDEGSTQNHGQLTVRQRAKECGSQVTDLQSLPMSTFFERRR